MPDSIDTSTLHFQRIQEDRYWIFWKARRMGQVGKQLRRGKRVVWHAYVGNKIGHGKTRKGAAVMAIAAHEEDK